MPENYGVLNIDDPQQIAEYEQHFYHGYAALVDNTLVRLLWDWDDDSRRLRTKVSYSDQIIYTWRDQEEQLLGAMAVNLTCTQFQGSMFGFTPNGSGDEMDTRFCEIINVMSTIHYDQSAWSGYIGFIRDYGFGHLVSQGYEIGYATCTKRRLRPYLRMGAKQLAQTTMHGEERFFIRWPLHKLVTPAL